jgi:hypothetical protein
MLRTPVALIGIAGVAFLAGAFVPPSFGAASLALSQGDFRQALGGKPVMSVRGDRLVQAKPAKTAAEVSIVELVGVSNATVILRDRNGEVLYRSDPRTGLTTISKGMDLPLVTLKEGSTTPAVQHPAVSQEERDVSRDEKPKRRNPVGCLRDVSPLVKASADRNPSLCLASLDQSLS